MMVSAGSRSRTGSVMRAIARRVSARGRGTGVKRPAVTAAGPELIGRPRPGESPSGRLFPAKRARRARLRRSPGELLVHLLGEVGHRLLRGGLALHDLLDLTVEDVRALEAAPLRRRRVDGRVVEQLLGERLALRVLEVARGLDALGGAREEADLLGELVQLVGLEHEVDERGAQRLVLG